MFAHTHMYYISGPATGRSSPVRTDKNAQPVVAGVGEDVGDDARRTRTHFKECVRTAQRITLNWVPFGVAWRRVCAANKPSFQLQTRATLARSLNGQHNMLDSQRVVVAHICHTQTRTHVTHTTNGARAQSSYSLYWLWFGWSFWAGFGGVC